MCSKETVYCSKCATIVDYDTKVYEIYRVNQNEIISPLIATGHVAATPRGMWLFISSLVLGVPQCSSVSTSLGMITSSDLRYTTLTVTIHTKNKV